jgi:hypothetical protein
VNKYLQYGCFKVEEKEKKNPENLFNKTITKKTFLGNIFLGKDRYITTQGAENTPK